MTIEQFEKVKKYYEGKVVLKFIQNNGIRKDFDVYALDGELIGGYVMSGLSMKRAKYYIDGDIKAKEMRDSLTPKQHTLYYSYKWL